MVTGAIYAVGLVLVAYGAGGVSDAPVVQQLALVIVWSGQGQPAFLAPAGARVRDREVMMIEQLLWYGYNAWHGY